MLNIEIYIYAITIISFCTRHFLGYGFSMIFVSLTVFVLDFSNTVCLVLLLEGINSILFSIKYYNELRLLESIPIKLYSFIGSFLGLLALKFIDTKVLLSISMIVLIFTCLVLISNAIIFAQNKKMLFISGLFSGFLNSVSSMSGPPIILYFISTQNSSKAFKARMAGYFLLLYIFTLGAYFVQGKYLNFQYWTIALNSIFIIIFLFLISNFITKIFSINQDIKIIRQITFYFIILLAVINLMKHLK